MTEMPDFSVRRIKTYTKATRKQLKRLSFFRRRKARLAESLTFLKSFAMSSDEADEALKDEEGISESVVTEMDDALVDPDVQSEGNDEALADTTIEEETDIPDVKQTKTRPKRTGGRRSRKRRGGARKVPESRQSNATEEIQPTDEAEIEVTAPDKEKEKGGEQEAVEGKEEEEEEEEVVVPREPSPVVTRRSNRKLQQQKDVEEEAMEIEHTHEEDDEQEIQEQPPLDLDQDEVESVASELESIASSSTLTTRSRRPKGNQDPRPRRQRGKVMKKQGPVTSGNVKGKSRRAIFKKSSTRAPSAVAKAVTSDRVYYRGQYFTKGDIVSVEDMDGSVYYAQLRGFLTDQYCEKSGVITWLLPTTNSPKPEDAFDPSTYVIGPEEDLPRKLEYFTFVMHFPDDYFYYKHAPYPTISVNADQEYLVARQGPKVCRFFFPKLLFTC